MASPVQAQFFEPTRSQGGLSAADSMAAFRNDSLDAGLIDRIESGRVPKDSATRIQDSLKQLSGVQQFGKRNQYFALHAGVGFQDLRGSDHFEAALNAKVTAAHGKLLQPYEPVHLYFPAGLEWGKRTFEYFDVVAKTHSFWYQQAGLLSDSALGRNQESNFSVQGHLAGIGGKLYIPNDILSAKDHGLIYMQVVQYWNVYGCEMYTDQGSAKANWEPSGSATEIQLGFSQALDSKWTWSAALTFIHTNWTSEKTWNEILLDSDTTPVHWGGNALQIRFYLFWNPRPFLAPKTAP